MKFEKIIEDVIVDYTRHCDSSFDNGAVSIAFINSIRPYEKELNEGEVYALFMEGLYYLNEMGGPLESIDEDCVEPILRDFFLQDLDSLLVQAEPYRWIPETLENVLRLSYSIFEIAKETYFMLGASDKRENSDGLFSQMVEMRKDLDSFEYIYRSRDEVLAIYEREISESQLDIDMIKGNKMLLSMRMADYIENGDIGIKHDVDFSAESPFSMPDNLFQ